MTIGVVIPARDEVARIRRCLRSVLASAHAIGEPVRIVVVADGCADGTADAARALGIEVIEIPASNVGAARGAGVEDLLAGGCKWIANTDADSVVPREWLSVHRILARRGADVVIGSVRPDFADLDDDARRLWIDTHAQGQAIGHVHGANLSFSAAAYIGAGGYRALPEHEDNDLVDRMRGEFAIVATGLAPVETSGRLVGRTAGGYAGYLRRLTAHTVTVDTAIESPGI